MSPVRVQPTLAREPLGGDRRAVHLGGVGARGQPGNDGGGNRGWRARVAALEPEGPRVHLHALGDDEPGLQVVATDPARAELDGEHTGQAAEPPPPPPLPPPPPPPPP